MSLAEESSVKMPKHQFDLLDFQLPVALVNLFKILKELEFPVENFQIYSFQ